MPHVAECEMHMQFLSKNQKKRGPLEELQEDGMIILKRVVIISCKIVVWIQLAQNRF
jgi:hypothetical protein